MFEIGRVCVKLAGRDAGMKCVIIDSIDDNFVIIDGQTRRRKCNLKHLEPTNQIVEISKNAPAAEVARVLKELGIEVFAKEAKNVKAKAKPRPKQQKAKKEKPVKQPVKQTRAEKVEKAKAKKQATEAVEAAIESEEKEE